MRSSVPYCQHKVEGLVNLKLTCGDAYSALQAQIAAMATRVLGLLQIYAPIKRSLFQIQTSNLLI